MGAPRQGDAGLGFLLLPSASAQTNRATLGMGSDAAAPAEGCFILGEALNHLGSSQPPDFPCKCSLIFALFFPSSYLWPEESVPAWAPPRAFVSAAMAAGGEKSLVRNG